MNNPPPSDRNPAYGTQLPAIGESPGKPPGTPAEHSVESESKPESAEKKPNAFGTIAAPLVPSAADERLRRATATHAAGDTEIAELFRTARIDIDRIAPLESSPRNVSAPPPAGKPLHAPAARPLQLPDAPSDAPPAHSDIARRPGRSTWNLRIRERGIAGHVSGVMNQVSDNPAGATGLQSALTVDDSVPEYEVIDQLGAGSMGIVYRARQTSLNRELAIKTLNPDAPNVQHDQAMFVSEAVVTANLVHPNIVPIHDLGRTAEGKLFYSMKQVTGTSWNHLIQKLTLEENLDILLKVCDAVAYAHSKGVINRDLKPENVIVGNFGEVSVLDWGLAITTERFEKKDSVIVDFRGGGGTPVYMPPELADSDVSGIGPHSDIYLLGAILFECLEGFPPHLLAETRTMTNPEDVLDSVIRAVLHNRIEMNVVHEGELMDIARKAMQSYPQHRHASVEEFQEAIREYRITGRAEELMQKVEAEGTTSYSEYQTAVALYEEGLRKWPNNKRAMEGDRKARLAYAELAHRKGDVDLGLQIIPAEDGGTFQAIRSKLKRTRRMRTVIRGTWSLLFVAALGLSGWLFVQRQELIAADARLADADEAIKESEQGVLDAKVAQDAALSDAARARMDAQQAQQEAEDNRAAAQMALTDKEQAETLARQAAMAAADAKVEADKAKQLAKEEGKKATAATIAAKEAEAAAAAAKRLAAEERKNVVQAKAEAAKAISAAHQARYSAFLAQAKAFEEVRNFQGIVDAVDELLLQVDTNPVVKANLTALQKIREFNARKVPGNAALETEQQPDEMLLSSDGTTVVLRSGDSLYVYRNYSGEESFRTADAVQVTMPDVGIADLEIADQGAAICLVGYDANAAWVWDGSAYTAVKLPGSDSGTKDETEFKQCLFSQDAKHLYLIGADDKITLRIYELNARSPQLLLEQQVFGDTAIDMRGVVDAVLLPDESGVVITTGDRGCRLVPVTWEGGQPSVAKRAGRDVDRVFPKLTGLDNLVGPKERFNPQMLMLSPDGSLLAVSNQNRLLVLQKDTAATPTDFPFLSPDVVGAAKTDVVQCHFPGGISAAGFSQDNQRLIVAQRRYLQIWDRQGGKFEDSDVEGLYAGHSLAGHADRILGAGFLNGSKNRILSHSFDKHLWVWNTERYADYVTEIHRLVTELTATPVGQKAAAREPFRRNRYLLTQAPQLPDRPLKPMRFQQARRVYSAEFSEDSERVIVGANDLAAHAFNSRDGERTLYQSMLDPKDLFFDPNRNNFLEGHLPEIVSIQFLPPDGDLLMTSDFFGSISVWDSRNDDDGIGFEKSRLLPEDSSCEVGVSRDGKWLVSGGVKNDGSDDIATSVDDFFVVIWKTDDIRSAAIPAAYRQLKGEHRFRVTAAAFSPDGKKVITAGRRGRFVLWDFENDRVLARADNGHGTDGVTGVFFSSNDEFVSAGFDGRVFRWKQDGESLVPTELERKTTSEVPDFIVRLRASADGRRFITSDLTREPNSDTYRLALNSWDADTGWNQTLPMSIVSTVDDKDKPWRHDVSWSADGSEVLYVHDGTIMVVDSETWKVRSAYNVAGESPGGKNAVRGVFAPGNNGERRIATFDGRFARMWNLNTGENMAVFRSHGPVVRACFSEDRRFVATASDSIRLFYSEEDSPDHGRTVFRLPRQVSGPSIFSDIAFSPKPGDYRFASVDVTGAVKLWDWAANQPPPEKTMLEVPGPDTRLSRELRNERLGLNSAVRWSQDATVLAAVQQGRLKIWRLQDQKLVDIDVRLPEGVQYVFNCLDFSPDKSLLTAGGIAYDEADRGLRSVALVWKIAADVANPIAIVDARDRHAAAEETRSGMRGITGIAFDARQQEIITGGADSRVLRWQMIDPELVLDPDVPASLTYLVEKEGLPGDSFTDPHRTSISSLDVSKKGGLVSADEAGFIVIWPPAD